MRFTIDTNVLVYVLDDREPVKHSAALSIVSALRRRDCRLGVQVCGELYSALTRRLKRARTESAQQAQNFLTAFASFSPTKAAAERALSEAAAGRFSYWDALLLASADEAGCAYCVSEDMADGARLGGIEVVQPFAADGASRRIQRLAGF